MPKLTNEKYAVLLIDDSEDDRFFIRMVLRRHPSFLVVGEVSDGEEAVSYLGGKDPYDDRLQCPFPDIILLDLKMPRKSGHEVLEWLQSQSFNHPFKAVLSGSALQEDIARSMALGADAYYKKEPLMQGLDDIVRKIEGILRTRRHAGGQKPFRTE